MLAHFAAWDMTHAALWCVGLALWTTHLWEAYIEATPGHVIFLWDMNKYFETSLHNLAAAIIVRLLGWSILQQKGTIVVVGILGVVSQSSHIMEAQKMAKLNITIFQ
jgi:hypothetical protein